MAYKIYDNFFLSNEVEDQFNSHLNLQQFCTVDNSLVGEAGMKRKINVYTATDGTQKLGMGEGNTKSIEVSYAEKEYEILLAQNRFEYYDEQAMTDPMLVPVGVRHMGTDMFNTVNADIFAEFNKATLTHEATSYGFGTFADAVIIIATKEAVTIFNKKGTEIEQITKNARSETAANTRLNTIFSRKYYLAALTDATKAVKITVAESV